MSLIKCLTASVAFIAWAAHESVQSAEIAVSQAQIDRLEIHLEEARPATQEAVALLPATIIPPMNSRIAVPAPFAGTVVSVHVLPGQSVEQGRTLMTIASRELVETLSQLRQAEANLAVASAVAERYRGLAEKNIASPTRAAETEAQRAGLEAVVDEHRRLVSLGKIKTDPDGSYALIAPRAGRIVEANVAPGASIGAMQAAVVFDTSDELWVEAQLPASLVGKVHPGDSITLEDGTKGKVLSVGHTLDPKTRSSTLTGTIPGSAGVVPGQMVTLSIHRQAAISSVEVPAQAVVWLGAAPSVFVRTEMGFAVQPVVLKGKTLRAATIGGGLTAGQKIAVSGLAQLENMIGAE
ncbi:RND transporter [Hyphomicrobium nitrativorans NL23]|uniref:RND transporter n=1 Tax=Hyphomicrobium nitrativorans NL23 TaxID=1029756 RepID=V5SBF0_9HYPH|nr:efflux RND transporter periplasmic adaptor subunit [Hyphomicrobium nitrativorans]AHB47848.1 RND transporter [Hyphomicrobium nitrativorans NL23]